MAINFITATNSATPAVAGTNIPSTNAAQQLANSKKTPQEKKKETAVQRALESIDHLEIIKSKNAECLKEQVAGAAAARGPLQYFGCWKKGNLGVEATCNESSLSYCSLSRL